MKYTCIRPCFWEERFWGLGDTFERNGEVKVPEHFRAEKSETPPTKGEEKVEDEIGEGSHIRETLKKLCAKNGITVEPDSTIEWMRDQLSDKGITVS